MHVKTPCSCRSPLYESAPLPSDDRQVANTSIFASSNLDYDALVLTTNVAKFHWHTPCSKQPAHSRCISSADVPKKLGQCILQDAAQLGSSHCLQESKTSARIGQHLPAAMVENFSYMHSCRSGYLEGSVVSINSSKTTWTMACKAAQLLVERASCCCC